MNDLRIIFYKMKTLTILLIISTYCFSQNDSTLQIDAEITRCFVQPYSLVQLIGGIDSLQSRLLYPVDAIESNIEGSVFIVVTIDTSGNPSNPIVIKGLGYGCDEEAIRLIITSKFLPAINNGKSIRSKITIRIKFRLPKHE